MHRSSGQWDSGHGGWNRYPSYSEYPQAFPGEHYWSAEQGRHSLSHPPPHTVSTSNQYPYPSESPYPAYPPSSYLPPHSQPPSFSLNPPSFDSAGSFHNPADPSCSHSSYSPCPPSTSPAYPPVAAAYTYPPSGLETNHSSVYPPSAPPQYPISSSQQSTDPSPYEGGPEKPSSYFSYVSQLTNGSFGSNNRPGAPSQLQSGESFSSTEYSFQGHQLSHSSSDSGSWSFSSSHFPNDYGAIMPYQSQGPTVPYSGELRSLKYHLLYGSLDVWIHSATNLPNLDTFSETLRQALVAIEPAIPKLQATLSKKITSDPYVSVVLRGATLARTTVISNNQDPVWEEHFRVDVAHKVADVKLVVKDNDVVGAQYIGEVRIPAESLISRPIMAQFFDVLNKDGKPCNPGAKLKISLEYTPLDKDPAYRYGVGLPPYMGVQHTYFPLRKGCRLTLYQDAHVLSNALPTVQLASGLNYEHRSCWEDICQSLVNAQHLIYIAGWSIYTKIKLIRDQDKARNQACYKDLGELLKWKAGKGGVRVLLLVWDDKTSHSIINNVGVMGTHDEETRRYFKHTGVNCLLAPRYADSKLSWVKQQVVGTLYTHHQKIVIVDTDGPNSKRRLTAFVGGLDLCDGRYDTPEHTLFHNLTTVFKDDYHNPTFPTKVESGGPREPWHDLHCKIEGRAVYDVLANFEQRWKKVAKWHGFFLKMQRGGDLLIDLEQKAWALTDIHDEAALNVMDESDPESWHIQVFRSIDSGSVKGFPKNAAEAEKQNLVGRKNVAIDTSIHTAYIKAIRSAQHFIYIENQYFLGSSFAWPSYKHAGANHLIPMEIALKIVSKIKARQRFAVYIVIPMWPEGDPNSLAVQEILYFQSQTMEMMYTLIAEALKEEQLDGHPTDFLNFFCLANRELKRANEPPPLVQPIEGSSQAKAFKSRRFMIYVHSKGMIVDDEYVIVGSANINQRSMDGSRDTEIAMGAYQQYHTWAQARVAPKGQVHGYRMSLWAEHLRANERCFMEPWSSECVKKVQSLTQRYWKQFTADEVTEMEGHLLPYPLEVERSGRVVALQGFEVFPDVGGKVLGMSTKLPDNLTS